MKIARRILLGLAALVLLAVVVAFSYRAVWQHRIANKTRVTSPNGIDEAKFIKVHGAEEWITIRGDNIENPVILFLHGGPSESNSPFVEFYTPFEKILYSSNGINPAPGNPISERAAINQS